MSEFELFLFIGAALFIMFVVVRAIINVIKKYTELLAIVMVITTAFIGICMMFIMMIK